MPGRVLNQTYLLEPDLQVGHVRLELLGHLVALVVEREPSVHEAK